MPDAAPPTVDTSSLDSAYTVVGELGSTDHCRTLTAERKTENARRRDDHTGVLISIFSTPEGDEANALSHLAADTKVLASESHRRLVPVIEGRWLDDDHFAVITQRLNDPTVTQRLASREAFSTIRIAAILRELNGLLDWAREQGIVHRVITGEGIYLEPRTDRVRVTFDIAPLHRVRPGEETRDARTIARLAMALLAGVEDPETCTVEMLQEMRPELPKRLAAATSELLEVKNAKTKTDIANFIALIGMSDPLYRGEEEEKRIRAEILEEQRAEREKLANERTAFETKMATERSEFESASTKERADMKEQMDRERTRLETERGALQKAATDERARLQKAMGQERAELTAKRAEMEKGLAAAKTEIERTAAQDRKMLEQLRAELKQRGEAEIERKRQVALEDVDDASKSELDEEEFSAPIFVGPNLVPLEALSFNDENEVLSNEPIVFEPTSQPDPDAFTKKAETKSGKDKSKDNGKRRPWLMPTAIGGGVVVLAIVAGATLVRLRPPHLVTPTSKPPVAHTPVQPPAQMPQSVVPLPAPGTVVDSAGGSIAPRVDSLPPKRASDETSRPRTQADIDAELERELVRVDAPKSRTETHTEQPTRQEPPPQPVQQPQPAPPPVRAMDDTVFDFRHPRPDSAVRRDTTAPVRRDTVPATPRDTTKPPSR
jgi:hypothetical protein